MKRNKLVNRFPPARVKRMMQKNEEVGKLAAGVPVVVSRSLELFVEFLIQQTAEFCRRAQPGRTVTPAHLKVIVEAHPQLQFLSRLFSAVPSLENVKLPSVAVTKASKKAAASNTGSETDDEPINLCKSDKRGAAKHTAGKRAAGASTSKQATASSSKNERKRKADTTVVKREPVAQHTSAEETKSVKTETKRAKTGDLHNSVKAKVEAKVKAKMEAEAQSDTCKSKSTRAVRFEQPAVVKREKVQEKSSSDEAEEASESESAEEPEVEEEEEEEEAAVDNVPEPRTSANAQKDDEDEDDDEEVHDIFEGSSDEDQENDGSDEDETAAAFLTNLD